MIDDNKDNPPLHYFKSDFEKMRERMEFWRTVAVVAACGCLGAIWISILT